MAEIILMGDDRVAAVPVADNGESLVDAGATFRLSSLKNADDPVRARARSGLRARLADAQDALPEGVRLCWVEGHRRADQQARYFEGYRAELAELDPSLSSDDTYRLASRYVSPPTIAPHVSGAAIDLTLCTVDGDELDMGCPVNSSPEESAGTCYFAADVPAAARRHRDVLATALTAAGLVNYPTEWWHWSYGDRYWALMTGRSHAIYGPVIDGDGR